MNHEKMGLFISELRKSNQMTQKDLAAKLNITDKAVSKWERGLSCPDISLLSSIADLLGVTTSELLNGEKNNIAPEDAKKSIDNALQYADKAVKYKTKSLQTICAIVFTLLLFVGIISCAIPDIVITGTFTWSLYPISSIVFTWLVFFPVIKWGKKGIFYTILALSVLIIPFLYVLDTLIKTSELLMPIGIRMSVIFIVFLWSIFILFTIFKDRWLLATSITMFLAIPVCILINFSLSKLIMEPIFDVWDILSISLIGIMSIVLFSIDFQKRKGKA